MNKTVSHHFRKKSKLICLSFSPFFRFTEKKKIISPSSMFPFGEREKKAKTATFFLLFSSYFASLKPVNNINKAGRHLSFFFFSFWFQAKKYVKMRTIIY